MKSQLNKGYLYQRKLLIRLFQIIDFLLRLFTKSPGAEVPSNINKVLLVKLDHLGDVLMTTSIFPIIKSNFPNAKMDIMIGEWSKNIVEDNPHVDEVIIFNHVKLNRSGDKLKKLLVHFQTMYSSIKKLRTEKYDVCLILRAYGSNGVLMAKLGGCKYIVGHPTGGFGPILDKTVAWNEGFHETEHYKEVLRTMVPSVGSYSLKYELYFNKTDNEYVDTIVNEYQLKEKQFLIFHPGTGNPAKMWALDNWGKLCAALSNRYQIVITGTAAERHLAQSLTRVSNSVVDLTGKFSIRQLAYFISLSKLIVTVDTLAAHLGSAINTQTLGIYSGITNPNQWRPLGNNVTIMTKSISCSPCFVGCANMHCMDITPEQVLAKIETLGELT
jgi:ADP-heptose:LPS heptosyltransferase